MSGYMIFGDHEWSGRAIHLLDPNPDEMGCVDVVLLDVTSEGQLRGRCPLHNVGKRATEDQVHHVFGSRDLADEIVRHVCFEAEEEAPVLAAAEHCIADVCEGVFFSEWAKNLKVTKQMNMLPLFRLAETSSLLMQAVNEDSVWKRLCRARWKTKFGFTQRWERKCASIAPGAWRAAFFEEERLPTSPIRPEELHELTFDFRFWLSFHIDPMGVRRSGLPFSVSRTVRLQPLPETTARRPDVPKEVYEGQLFGHPNGDVPRISWFWNQERQSMQWGYWPQLWPQGRARRLRTWAIEIQNQNVCMRSIEKGESRADFDDLIGELCTCRYEDGDMAPDLQLPRSYVRAYLQSRAATPVPWFIHAANEDDPDDPSDDVVDDGAADVDDFEDDEEGADELEVAGAEMMVEHMVAS